MSDKIIPGIQVLSYGVPIEAPPGDEWVAVLRSKLPKRTDKERLESLRTALEQIRALQAEKPNHEEYEPVDYEWACARWEAAQIADAALAPLLEHSPMPGEGDTDADKGDEAGGV